MSKLRKDSMFNRSYGARLPRGNGKKWNQGNREARENDLPPSFESWQFPPRTLATFERVLRALMLDLERQRILAEREVAYVERELCSLGEELQKLEVAV